MIGPAVTLLGPRHRPTDDQRAIGDWPSGPVAAITADPADLQARLGLPVHELGLADRWRAVLQADDELARADRELRDSLAESQRLYARRLRHAVAAVTEVSLVRPASPAQQAAVAAAVADVCILDREHLAAVSGLRREFTERLAPNDRVARHHLELADLLGGSAGLVLAGGHVGELVHLISVFGLGPMITGPVLAWLAGAMLLADRIMLFHDHFVAGPEVPQIFSYGLGLVREAVVLPDARARLDLHDRERMRVLAARLRPARAILLDDRESITVVDDQLSLGARLLDRRGGVRTVGDDHDPA